jgi:hypothetical protein
MGFFDLHKNRDLSFHGHPGTPFNVRFPAARPGRVPDPAKRLPDSTSQGDASPFKQISSIFM